MNRELQLLQIFTLLATKSQNNFIVGGAVRDRLLGRPVKDYDIVTDIDINTLEILFKENDWNVDIVGKQFLVLTISKEGIQYEIANFRKDSVTSDGRRPDAVSIGTIEEDAQRRDFTINALYLNPQTGVVLDLVGGLADLEKRILRFIGKPRERIREDYLRVWRAFRFKVQLGFEFHRGTERALREYFIEAYKNSNPQRVLQELIKL